MGRAVWSSGSKSISWREVDVDQFSFRSVIQKSVEVTAFVWDAVTGSNRGSAWASSTSYAVGDKVTESGEDYVCLVAHTSSGTFATDFALNRWKQYSIDHGGPGTGSLLGYPMVQQLLPNVLFSVVSGVNEHYVAILPVYVPLGETSIRVELDLASLILGEPRVEVLDVSDFSLVGAFPMMSQALIEGFESGQTLGATATGLTGGTVYVVGVALEFPGSSDQVVTGFRVFQNRKGKSSGLPAWGGDPTDPVFIPVQGTADGDRFEFADIPSTMLADDLPVQAYVVQTTAQNQAGIDEMCSGRPAFGMNSNLQLLNDTSDIDGVDDVTETAFYDGSQSTHSDEPTFDVPMFGWAFGPAPYDGLGLSANGKVCDGWFCPPFLDETNVFQTINSIHCPFPDFERPSGSPKVRLRAMVLLYSPDQTIFAGTETIGEVRVATRTGAGSTLTNQDLAFTSLDRPDGAQGWAIADFTTASIDFDPDEEVRCFLALRSSLLKDDTNGGSVRIAGWTVWFERART